MSPTRHILPLAVALTACASQSNSDQRPRHKPWSMSCKDAPAKPAAAVEPGASAEPIGDPPTGDLPKKAIREVIRGHLCEVSRCYEAEVIKDRNLAGTITVVFRIASNGLVYRADASGIGNANVEECVARVIRSMRFPVPSGGGFVKVTYPFTFRSQD